MKFIYTELLNILKIAEKEITKNDQTEEFWSDELIFIEKMKNILMKDSTIYYEIKGSDQL